MPTSVRLIRTPTATVAIASNPKSSGDSSLARISVRTKKTLLTPQAETPSMPGRCRRAAESGAHHGHSLLDEAVIGHLRASSLAPPS